MTATAPSDDDHFGALVEGMRADRGFDLGGYKRSTVERRIAKRMAQVGVPDHESYRDYLQVHPEEYQQLFDTLLINVTAFLRDAEHWSYLADHVLPELVQRAGDAPIRVWSAGCASGEEAYTIAILLAEQFGTLAIDTRCKIYATDIDEDALTTARQATYDDDDLASLPADLVERYFERTGAKRTLRPELRRAVIFGRHDLQSDAPISRLDLLVCRNVLMYFNVEAQEQILRRLHFALREDGYLFLGKAEMLLSRTVWFEPLDVAHRVFRRGAGPQQPEVIPSATRPREHEVASHGLLRDAALDASPIPQVVVDMEGRLALANTHARTTFGLGPHDLGRPLQDLELSYRPAELRDPIQQVHREGRRVELRNIVRTLGGDGERQYFDIALLPLHDTRGQMIGVSVAFEDVTRIERLQKRLQQSTQELETAYEELQSTNEELETTNEELQSTNEELETTNEELQSTISELESLNAELQSTSVQQDDANVELSAWTEQVERLNAYLSSILSSLTVAVVVVDADLIVQVWNARAFDLWGLREDEVLGRPLLDLDFGMDVRWLADPARACLEGEQPEPVVLQATSRRGRPFPCRVRLAPLQDRAGARRGVVIIMEPEEG